MENYKKINLELTLKNQELREMIQTYKNDNNKLNSILLQQNEQKVKFQKSVTGFVNTISINLNKLLNDLFNIECNNSDNSLLNNSNISEVKNVRSSCAYENNFNVRKRKNEALSLKLSNSIPSTSQASLDDTENLSDFKFIENSLTFTSLSYENKTNNNNSARNLSNNIVTRNKTEIYEANNDDINGISTENCKQPTKNVTCRLNINKDTNESNSFQSISQCDLELNTIIEDSSLEESTIYMKEQIATSTPFNKNKKDTPSFSKILTQSNISGPYVVIKRLSKEVIDKNLRREERKENIDKKRPQRSARPTSLREPKLNTKMRQPKKLC